MKRLLLVLCLVVAPVATFTGCATPPVVQRIETLTLLSVATTADTAMKTAAGLYHDGKLTTSQWAVVADFHDTKFLPVFDLAFTASQANWHALAPAELALLVTQLVGLVNTLKPTP